MAKKKNPNSDLFNEVEDDVASFWEEYEDYLYKLNNRTCEEKCRDAYHEAGHVVAYYNLGKKFDYVTLYPLNYAGELEGSGCVHHPEYVYDETRNIVGATMYLAGFMAEYKQYGDGDLCGYDLSGLDGIVSMLTNNERGEILFRQQLADFAIHVFDSPGSWEAVEAVAQALMEHDKIDYAYCIKIIQQAKRKAKKNCAA